MYALTPRTSGDPSMCDKKLKSKADIKKMMLDIKSTDDSTLVIVLYNTKLLNDLTNALKTTDVKIDLTLECDYFNESIFTALKTFKSTLRARPVADTFGCGAGSCLINVIAYNADPECPIDGMEKLFRESSLIVPIDVCKIYGKKIENDVIDNKDGTGTISCY